MTQFDCSVQCSTVRLECHAGHADSATGLISQTCRSRAGHRL